MGLTNLAKRLARSVPVLLSLAVLAASVAAFLVEPALMTTLRNAVFDGYQRLAPRAYEPAPVRIVDLDDESLARVGQWPWSRSILADLVTRLQQAGAAAIALDVLFAERDRTTPSRSLMPWMDDPRVRAIAESLPDHDRLFAEAVGRGSVVTAFVLNQDPALERRPLVKASMATTGDDPRLFMPGYKGAVASLPELEQAAAGNGALNIAPGADGILRRVQLLLHDGESLYPTLTAEALRVGRGEAGYVVKSSGASGESRFGGQTGVLGIRVGTLAVPTDAHGAVWLHYSGPVPERTIAAWRVLAGEVEADRLAGSIVFVGTSAAGLKDLRFNPLGDLTAGAEVHAEAVEQILQGTYLTRPDWAKALELLYILILWPVLTAAIFRLGAGWAALIGALASAGSMLGSWLAFVGHNLLLDPTFPILASLAVYLVCSLSRQVRTEGEKRFIRKAFSSYISPNLVRYLIEHPDELDLGGERRECSFVFTDLAGFTGLVESLSPAAAVQLLNEYLEGMTPIALRWEGTLDRIVGDAVAVMFSAPVKQPDHATRAVGCALEMDRFARSFRRRKRDEGLELGITRIGVHTGKVTIGNVGGPTLVDYRALGDPVNTAARLETVNGQLGTRVCVSGATVAGCPAFSGRPIGALILKGKTEAVEAFEPLTDEEAGSPATAAYLAAFERLRGEDPAAEEAFAALLEADPDDGLAAFHLDRLRRGERGATILLQKK
jgi:adenylate cyclase